MALRRQPKFKSDEIVMAVTAFASGDDVIARGTRLRGDHRLVQAFPSFWAVDGTPADEMPSDWDAIEVPQIAPEFHKVPVLPPSDECARAVVAFYEVGTGAQIARGQILPRSNPVVKRNPGMFETVPVPL